MLANAKVKRLFLIGFFIGIWIFPTSALADRCSEAEELIGKYELPDILPRSIGIEIEGSILKKFSYKQMQGELKEVIEKTPGVSNVTVTRGLLGKTLGEKALRFYLTMTGTDQTTYIIEYDYEGRHHKFNFGLDYSINAPRGRKGLEIRSPIMETKADLLQYLNLVEHLKSNYGFQETPLTGGLHVHVGMPEATSDEVASVVENFAAIEGGLPGLFASLKARAKYMKPLTEKLKNRVKADEPVTLKELISASGGKGHDLNIAALNKYGTVEYRLFNSTVDIDTILGITDFCLRFTDAAIGHGPELQEITRGKSATDALDAVLAYLRIDMPGPQRAITRKLLSEIERAQAMSYSSFSNQARAWVKGVTRPSAYYILSQIISDVVEAVVEHRMERRDAHRPIRKNQKLPASKENP